MKKIIHILLTVTLFFSCIGKGSKISENIPILECINCDNEPDMFENYKINNVIKLETTSACLISEIQQVKIVDSIVVILGLNEVLYVFNTEGKFINQVGKKGEGPDEYITLRTFFIVNNNIVIIDDVRSVMLKYDFSGNFIESEAYPLDFIRRSNMAVMNNKNLLLYNMMNMEDNMQYSILNIKEKKLIGKYFSYDPIKTDYIYSFSNHPISKFGDSISVILPLCDIVYELKDSQFFPKFRVQTPWRMANKTQITGGKTAYSSNVFALKKDGFFTGFTGIFESKEYLFLDYKYNGAFFVFDKLNGKGTQYSYSFNKENKEIPFFNILGESDNFLVGVATTELLLRFKYDLNLDDEVNKKFINIVDTSFEEDNPVLIFYDLVTE